MGYGQTAYNRIVCAAPPTAALVKKDGLPEYARRVLDLIKIDYNTYYDEKDSIGKRYRRQDAIGTPFCITVDHQTLADDSVTLRERDTMQQQRVPVGSLPMLLAKKTGMSERLKQLL